MNSLSYSNCHDHDEYKHDCHKHPVPGNAILRANNGSLGPSTVTLVVGTLPVAQAVASVSVDTARLDPATILVDFAGVLTSRAAAAVGLTYNFTLFKTSSFTGVRQSIKTFSISQSIAIAAIPDSRTLKLEYSACDDSCDDRCTVYTLELTSITATAAVVLDYSTTGTISVLAVD